MDDYEDYDYIDYIADFEEEICDTFTMELEIVLRLCDKLNTPLEHEEHEVKKRMIKLIQEFLEGISELAKCDEMLQRSFSKLSKLRAEGNLGYLEERADNLLDKSIKIQNEINAAMGSKLYGAMSDKICKLRQVKEKRANARRKKKRTDGLTE